MLDNSKSFQILLPTNRGHSLFRQTHVFFKYVILMIMLGSQIFVNKNTGIKETNLSHSKTYN